MGEHHPNCPAASSLEGACQCEELCSSCSEPSAPQQTDSSPDPEEVPALYVGAEADIRVYCGEKLFGRITDGFSLPYSRDGTSLIEIPEMLVEDGALMPGSGPLRIVIDRPTGELVLDGATILSVGSEDYEPLGNQHEWHDVKAQFGGVVPSPAASEILERAEAKLDAGINTAGITVVGCSSAVDWPEPAQCGTSETGKHEPMSTEELGNLPCVDAAPNVLVDQIVSTADGGMAQCYLYVCKHCRCTFLEEKE